MPIYEYQCKKCAHRFEEIRKFSDKHPTKCPKCGGALEQVISAPAVQFKGSGWYVTDYARKGTTSATSTSSESEGSDKKDKKETKDTKESKDDKPKEDKSKSETSSRKPQKN
jgi:putative FmdB family regulatory protein